MLIQVQDNAVVFLDDNNVVKAEVDFPDVTEDVVEINRTYVDESERGRGLAERLMGRAVSHIRAQGKKARLSCSYAKKYFAAHSECSDILDNSQKS